MGALQFFEEVSIRPGTDLDTVFHEEIRRARSEHGGGGYSGTIAEKRHYRIVKEYPTREAAEAAADNYNNWPDWLTDKWGPAGAFVYPDGAFFVGKASW